MDTITVRKPDFDFPSDMPLVFMPDDPETSLYFLAAWMTLPYLEPYLIRSVKAASQHIADPARAEEMRLFCTQEGVHFKEHARANKAIRAAHPQLAPMVELEEKLKAQFQRFSDTKSLRWNLAYAEAFESITSASACSQFELRMFDGMLEPLGDLFAWHIMEELEHRCVAFEALEAVEPGYWFRVVIGTRCLFHYMRWTLTMYKQMVSLAPELLDVTLSKAAKKERDAARRRFLFKTLPRWLKVYSPRYHPRDVRLPENFFEVQAKYDAYRQDRHSQARAELG